MHRSCRDRDRGCFHRELDEKHSSPPHLALHTNTTSMPLDDPLAEGQTQSSADTGRLGGKEGFEDALPGAQSEPQVRCRPPAG